MRPKSGKGIFTWLKKNFRYISNGDDKLSETNLVFQAMLPQWKGLCPAGRQTEHTAQEALNQFDQVCDCAARSRHGEWLLISGEKESKKIRNQVSSIST